MMNRHASRLLHYYFLCISIVKDDAQDKPPRVQWAGDAVGDKLYKFCHCYDTSIWSVKSINNLAHVKVYSVNPLTGARETRF